MSVLTHDKVLGSKKFREIAEQYILQQIEQESLTPEERAQAEKERKLSEYERKEKETAEKAEQEKNAQLEKHWAEQYEKTIISALQSSDLPKTPYTVKRMAELMQKNLDHGLDLEPQYIAQLVKEDFIAEQKALIGSASAEQLIAMFGDDVANKIRKYDLSKYQAKNPVPKKAESAVQTTPTQKMTPREYTEYLKNKFSKQA
jgi:hypothetical protein